MKNKNLDEAKSKIINEMLKQKKDTILITEENDKKNI